MDTCYGYLLLSAACSQEGGGLKDTCYDCMLTCWGGEEAGGRKSRL